VAAILTLLALGILARIAYVLATARRPALEAGAEAAG
jgi:hypothetical protein